MSIFVATTVAKKAAPAGAQKTKHLDVEEDPEKLCKFVCSANIYTEGSDPEIKPDSQYPEWLWTLRTERGAPKLEDLDPNTYRYWRHVRRQELFRQAKIKRVKRRFKEYG